MATGWAGDGAVQDQIDATVSDAVERARRQLKAWPWSEAMRGMRRADSRGTSKGRSRRTPVRDVPAGCRRRTGAQLFNRRGSKDSQLR